MLTKMSNDALLYATGHWCVEQRSRIGADDWLQLLLPYDVA
jgi:hypothetical protein